jgi:hypothetical protein
MPLSRAALYSFIAMVFTDLVETAMVIWESEFIWWAAGICDVMGYIASLVCSVLALDSILRDGWRTRRSLVLIAVISLANFVGTGLGVALVAHITHH